MDNFTAWLDHYRSTHGTLTIETMEASAAAWNEQQKIIDHLQYIVNIFEDAR